MKAATEKELTWTEGQRVPLFCIYGNHVWFTKTLDDLVTLLDEFRDSIKKREPKLWETWMAEGKKHNVEQVWLEPTREYLKGVLEKNGYISSACLECNAEVSQAMYERMGYHTVRVGTMLLDPNLLNDEVVMEKLVRGDKYVPPPPKHHVRRPRKA